jgi:hypothetical protein
MRSILLRLFRAFGVPVEPSLQLADRDQLAAPEAHKRHLRLDMRTPGIPGHTKRFARLLDTQRKRGRASFVGSENGCRACRGWSHRGYRPRPVPTGQRLLGRFPVSWWFHVTSARKPGNVRCWRANLLSARPMPRRARREMTMSSRHPAVHGADLAGGANRRRLRRDPCGALADLNAAVLLRSLCHCSPEPLPAIFTPHRPRADVCAAVQARHRRSASVSVQGSRVKRAGLLLLVH